MGQEKLLPFNPESPIACVGDCTFPNPASIRLAHLAPKMGGVIGDLPGLKWFVGIKFASPKHPLVVGFAQTPAMNKAAAVFNRADFGRMTLRHDVLPNRTLCLEPVACDKHTTGSLYSTTIQSSVQAKFSWLTALVGRSAAHFHNLPTL
jgi:hypothetical protein